MTEPITITYTPNAKDYSSTLRAFAYDRKRIWSTVVISMIALAVAERALYARDLGDSFVPGVIVLVVFVVGLMWILSAPTRIENQARKNPAFTSPVTWQIDSTNVMVASNGNETKFSWATFSKVTDLSDYYFFIYEANPRAFLFIPKRSFVDSSQEREFRDLLVRQGKLSV